MDIPFEVVANPPDRVARNSKYAALKTALVAAGERGEWIAIHRADLPTKLFWTQIHAALRMPGYRLITRRANDVVYIQAVERNGQ